MPLGMVDLKKYLKMPCPVFDSTYQAMEWSFAINDWTTKTDEPNVTFAQAFINSFSGCGICESATHTKRSIQLTMI
jgi:hypothetical protein